MSPAKQAKSIVKLVRHGTVAVDSTSHLSDRPDFFLKARTGRKLTKTWYELHQYSFPGVHFECGRKRPVFTVGGHEHGQGWRSICNLLYCLFFTAVTSQKIEPGNIVAQGGWCWGKEPRFGYCNTLEHMHVILWSNTGDHLNNFENQHKNKNWGKNHG